MCTNFEISFGRMMYMPRALPFGNKALEKCMWQFLSIMMCFELMVDVQDRSNLRHCYLSSNEGPQG